MSKLSATVRMWTALTLVGLSSASLASSQITSALPANWHDLPSPETLVRLDTPNGSFQLPMGYLNDWFVFEQRPVVTDGQGRRVFTGSFAIHFVYPGGTPDVKAYDTPEVSDIYLQSPRDLSVVWIYDAVPPERSGRAYLERDVLDRYEPGQLKLVPSMSDSRLQKVYAGVAAGSKPGRRIGVALSCAVNCGLSMYYESRNLVVYGLIAGRFKDHALEIAQMSQSLYEQWFHFRSQDK